jgi:hypothetical protein
MNIKNAVPIHPGFRVRACPVPFPFRQSIGLGRNDGAPRVGPVKHSPFGIAAIINSQTCPLSHVEGATQWGLLPRDRHQLLGGNRDEVVADDFEQPPKQRPRLPVVVWNPGEYLDEMPTGGS